MSFKVDESFLRFVTMGAAGTRAVARMLDQAGHRIIELERYSCSNKIWSTKIKRLRLADLLCLTCGTRFEVRTKSDLEVKMSDSPDNPDRRWDTGLRDRDICAFIASRDQDRQVQVAEGACYFAVGDMRGALAASRLGPPKSASEGAERDRTWPTWTPSRDGRVAEVTDAAVRVRYDDGEVLYRSPGMSVDALLQTAFQGTASTQVREWAQYALGRLPEDLVRARSSELGIPMSALGVLAPLWRGLQRNWLAGRPGDRLAFVARQGF